MPEHIRSLIVILFLAGLIFHYVRTPAAGIIGTSKFAYRRNMWIAVTLIAFLSHNFWVYVLLTWIVITVSSSRDSAKVGLFLFLLFAVPQTGLKIPGLGLVNYLFELNHQRLLVISILLPTFLKMFLSGGQKRPSHRFFDNLLKVYLLLTVALYFRGTTFTDALRFGLDQFLDIYVPYYVAAHLVRNMDDFKDVVFSYVVAMLILSIIGVFEIARHWHVYAAVNHQLGIPSYPDAYLKRDGLLRAYGSLSRIAMGYVLAVGLGYFLVLKPYFSSQRAWKICLVILVAGLISPLSRGPWVGAVTMIVVIVFFSKRKSGALVNLGVAAAIFVIVVSLTPLGSTLKGLIPFVGETESATITYRQQLFENSWIVIKRNPVLGSVNYLEAPEMEAMRQGQGIIDIVNTYLTIALRYGFVGLTMFTGMFIGTGWKVFRRFSAYRDIDAEKFQLGLTLLAVLLGIMVIIATVSRTPGIPIMYWITLGLCSAYLKLDDEKAVVTKESAANESLSPAGRLAKS